MLNNFTTKAYILQVLNILTYANLTVIETDGPFGGYTCSATNHSYHEGN